MGIHPHASPIRVDRVRSKPLTRTSSIQSHWLWAGRMQNQLRRDSWGFSASDLVLRRVPDRDRFGAIKLPLMVRVLFDAELHQGRPDLRRSLDALHTALFAS